MVEQRNSRIFGRSDPAELLADRGAKAYYILDAGMGSDEPLECCDER
jgi:hypothetical protein